MSGDQSHEAQVRELTSKVERGESVTTILNSMPIEERVQMAREMKELNDRDRSADPSLPQLEITIQKEFEIGGVFSGPKELDTEHLMDMKILNSPNAVFYKDRHDVYDMNSQSQTAMDSFSGRPGSAFRDLTTLYAMQQDNKLSPNK
ncbi:MAG: hypothetical protein AB7W16_28430 [Candidatus Obscuribacterales bacterium]